MVPIIYERSGGAGAAETRLALKLHNHIAEMVTVPIEHDFEFGSGPQDATTCAVYVQPVIPFEQVKGWLLVTRTIVPVIPQESVSAGDDDETGLGVITQSFFVSPDRLAGG